MLNMKKMNMYCKQLRKLYSKQCESETLYMKLLRKGMIMRPQDTALVDVLISIDTTKKVGATSVYGMVEFERILREGCEARGYSLKFDYKGGTDLRAIAFID